MSKTVVVTLVLTAMAVGACRGGGPSKEAPPAEAAGPVRGGHIRMPSNEPTYLNPIVEQRFDLANNLIFEGMVGFDTKGDPVPRLAESFQQSADGRTITFKLRAGGLWHDGHKITASDVAFTFDAMRGSRNSRWKNYMLPVSKLEIPDERTVVVSYAHPYAAALAAWTMPILPAHVYRTDGDLTTSTGNREAVGSGPFKLSRWEPGKRIVLGAHDKWWFGRPLLASVELVLGISDGDVLSLLKRGELDWAPVRIIDDQMALEQAPELREEFEASRDVEARIRLIAWNGERKPFEDVRVRQALTLALDRPRVLDDVFAGQAQALAGPFFPPPMFAGDPAIAPYPFDLGRARKLLDEAAPAKGGQRFAVEVIAPGSLRSPTTDSAFAIFRRDFESLGIALKLTILPAKDYFDRLARRDFDAAFFGWLPDIPDPDPYALLHSSQIATGANYAFFANTEVDTMLDQARQTVDREQRRALYARVHRIVADEMPYTALWSPYGNYAWSRRLRGVSARDVSVQPLVPGIGRWWLQPRVAKPISQ
jgi:peptide/nickel transport system substrate-binding protein